MKTKLKYLLVVMSLLVVALTGCEQNKTTPDQKLSLGTISYDATESIIYWEKVTNAISYDLTISGEGTTKTINESIDDSYYNVTNEQFEYNFTTGVENKEFVVELIAVADGKNYASSNMTTAKFKYGPKVEPQQLKLGTISYDNTKNTVYWQKVDNAAYYEFKTSGEGVSEESRILVNDSYYNQTTKRFEVLIEKGINGKIFKVEITAYAEGTDYLNSDVKTAEFTCVTGEQPQTKLVIGQIYYDKATNTIYWDEVTNALNYLISISGSAVTNVSNVVVDSSSYNQLKARFEYQLSTGIERRSFTVKLTAVGDGIKYLTSNQASRSFAYGNQSDYDYSDIEYYADLGLESVDDSEVKAILNQKLNDYTKLSYGDARYTMIVSDISLEDPNKTYGIYNGKLLNNVWDSGATFNREHVWPCARIGASRPENSTKGITSDLHNIRVSEPGINSTRSSKYFVQGTSSSAGVVGSNGFYPGDDHAGDVARICFYMATMYLNLTLVNEEDLPNAASYTQANAFMADLNDMLNWHISDPVDDFEILRNEIIFGYQKNRNPYVDFPDLVQRVFGVGIKTTEGKIFEDDTMIMTVTLIEAVYVDVPKNKYLFA